MSLPRPQKNVIELAGPINMVPQPKTEQKIHTTIIGNGTQSLFVAVKLQTLDTGRTTKIQALVDSGATGSFVDRKYAESQQWNLRELEHPVLVSNVDGTTNSSGKITHAIDLLITFGEHKERMPFSVADIGSTSMILGHNWLKRHNPSIDWTTKKIEFKNCPKSCGYKRQALPAIHNDEDEDPIPEIEEDANVYIRRVMIEEEEDRLFYASIRASETPSQRFYREKTPKEEMEQSGLIPDQYKEFSSVFSKSSFDELPEKRKWDHAIELKDDFKEKFTKVYPLNPHEQKQLDEFIEENLATGRICPSKSPMASPVFFIKKKDGSLRLIQDYCALNEMTIKNRYPLPLISELLDKLKKARYFTALDVRWGYNNIRIKEGDEWKAAFRTNRGLYEPTVMFFGLTNSPATFQAMMNEIFRELITEGFVVVYLDDILIFTETMEEHTPNHQKSIANPRR